MRWGLIHKDPQTIPKIGRYKVWKQHLADEGGNRCVYCSISEGRFGGIRNFCVEHFRPKSKFKELENEYRNLFIACSICNSFKGDDWLSEPENYMKEIAYISPLVVNYNDVFILSPDKTIVGTCISSAYMIEKIYLNRPQLVLERRFFVCCETVENLQTKTNKLCEMLSSKSLVDSETVNSLLLKIIDNFSSVMSLLAKINRTPPYNVNDLKRS